MANEMDRKDTLRAGEQPQGWPTGETWNRDNNGPGGGREGLGHGAMHGGPLPGRGETGSGPNEEDDESQVDSRDAPRQEGSEAPSTGSEPPRRKQRRGFAAMDPAKQREIASKGGKASHEQGTGHEWDSEAAREAGRKGGQASRGGRGKIRSEGPGGTGGTNQ